MGEEEKVPWQTDRKCPRCKTLLRLQAVTETEKFRYERIVCGMCGFSENTKIPLEQPVAKMPEPTERKPYAPFRMARRVEDKG